MAEPSFTDSTSSISLPTGMTADFDDDNNMIDIQGNGIVEFHDNTSDIRILSFPSSANERSLVLTVVPEVNPPPLETNVGRFVSTGIQVSSLASYTARYRPADNQRLGNNLNIIRFDNINMGNSFSITGFRYQQISMTNWLRRMRANPGDRVNTRTGSELEQDINAGNLGINYQTSSADNSIIRFFYGVSNSGELLVYARTNNIATTSNFNVTVTFNIPNPYP